MWSAEKSYLQCESENGNLTCGASVKGITSHLIPDKFDSFLPRQNTDIFISGRIHCVSSEQSNILRAEILPHIPTFQLPWFVPLTLLFVENYILNFIESLIS